MIWIASYPRSGNTFMRNLFFDVFGMESASYPIERNYVQGKDYQITKTHMLPHQVMSLKEDDFVIYLIRDGRDSIVSNAHYRKNFVHHESNFNANIRENILALRGSYFGGWATNATEWSKRADLIIRFEDVTQDPISFLELVRKRVALPSPDYSKIKSFDELKFGLPKYGSGGNGLDRKAFAESFFHKGTSGQYKTEMSTELQELFWCFHGDVMPHFGYSKTGEREDYQFTTRSPIKRSIPFTSKIIIAYYGIRLYWDLFKNKLKRRTNQAANGKRKHSSPK